MAPENGHRLERLVFFSDAIFAIAITLLILDIHVPDLPRNADNDAWRDALIALWPHVMAFLVSFFVIGRLWVAHHGLFALVARYNPRLMWPNLLLLLGVVFLPFATGLISTGTRASWPYAVYCACLLFTSLMKAWLTLRALRPDTLAPDVSATMVKVSRRGCWLMPLASGVALVLAFFVPPFNMFGLALMGVGRRLAWLDPGD